MHTLQTHRHCRYKKIVVLLLLVLIGNAALAQTKQIQDSLTLYLKAHANFPADCKLKVSYDSKHSVVRVSGTMLLSEISWTQAMSNEVHEMVSRILWHADGKVRIFDKNGLELSELVRTWERPRETQPQHITRPIGTPLVTKEIAYTTEQGLAGRHIALYGSHGLYFNLTNGRWMWQRARLFTTIEDLFTSSFTIPFLVPMLENAGAVVLQPRERDTQTEEVIVDDSEAAGDWERRTTDGWGKPKEGVYSTGEITPLYGKQNPFKMGGYAVHKDLHKDSLIYTPRFKKEGEYAVYVSYKTLINSTKKAKYTIVHKGTRTTFFVNQQMGGGTWIYLGTFAFGQREEENYVIVEDGKEDDKITTSDAIRFGGGMGSVARRNENSGASETQTTQRTKSKVSGYPRWMEGARYWLQYAGFPDTIYTNHTGKKDLEYIDDFTCRGCWANYLAGGSCMNPKEKGLGIPIDLFLALHSDSGTTPNDSIYGTLAIYKSSNRNNKNTYPNGVSRMRNRDLCDYIQSQIAWDLRSTYAPEWAIRPIKDSGYREASYPEMPSMLLELLSHQNLADMRYGLDPRFRFAISRAIYKGILRFLHEQYGTEAIVQPLPVSAFRINLDNNGVATLNWQAQLDSLEETARPTYYVVYTRKNDGDWDNGTQIQDTCYTLSLDSNTAYDFRIAAGNAGGLSFPSETLSAGWVPNSSTKVMVVNGFTRICAPESFDDGQKAGFVPGHYGIAYGKEIAYTGEQYEFDRGQQWITDNKGGWGASYLNQTKNIIVGNTFDYPVWHGRCLLATGCSYSSSSLSGLNMPDSTYTLLDVILGKQKTTTIGTYKKQTDFQTFPIKLRNIIEAFCLSGRQMLVSGSYIVSDMTSAEEQLWLQNVLHISSKHSTSNATKSGDYYVINEEINGHFPTEPNSVKLCIEAAEGLESTNGAQAIAYYSDSDIPAVLISYPRKNSGEGKQIIAGFPLESANNFNEIYTFFINTLIR